MTTKAPYRYELADDQLNMLIQIARDELGDHLKQSELDERILTLFEDIAGFESLAATKRKKLLHLLWLRYQTACQRK